MRIRRARAQGVSIVVPLLLAAVVGTAEATDAPSNPADHVIYLHGAIVGRQGLPAVHPQFGKYAFDDIVAAFVAEGFVVHAEVRRPLDDPWDHPRAVAGQVDSLLAAGLPPDRITVVGGSLGGIRAAMVSHLLAEPEVRYVLLGACSTGTQKWWRENEVRLTGRVLSVWETSDAGHGSCGTSFERCSASLTAQHEISVSTGLGHGFLYRPLPAWIDPAVAWARRGTP